MTATVVTNTRLIIPGTESRALEAGQRVEPIATHRLVRVADGTHGFVPAKDLQETGLVTAPEAASEAGPSLAPAVRTEAGAVDTGPEGRLPAAGSATAPPVLPSLRAARIDIQSFVHSAFIGEPIEADREFHALLLFLAGVADQLDIKIHVTSSFRRRDETPDGAIVPPAKRSNHLIGHAIDMNLTTAGEWFNSKRLAREQLIDTPRNIREFIGEIRAHPLLRWGGDFVRADPVHIDDNFYRRDERLWMRKFESLRPPA
jgi:hypothetical protein